MTPEHAGFVNTVVVPVGLIAIMFSLGLSLTGADLLTVLRRPRALLFGLGGQLLLLPPLAYLVATILALPPEMAIGLIVLAACPGGVTSNAVAFAFRANVALSVALTAIASLITVFTTPFLVSVALRHFSAPADVPEFSVLDTVLRLATMTAGPVALGMIARHAWPATSKRLVVWLRPASMIVLISVIGLSLLVSAGLVFDNLLKAGPAAFALNALALTCGLLLGKWAGLQPRDVRTIAIEVGIQNATVATFLTLSVLNDLALAITPTIYGMIMILNATALLRYLEPRTPPSDRDEAAS